MAKSKYQYMRKAGPNPRCFAASDNIADVKAMIKHVGHGPFTPAALSARLDYVNTPRIYDVANRTWYNLLAYRWRDLYR
jgi:hypothetical protein